MQRQHIVLIAILALVVVTSMLPLADAMSLRAQEGTPVASPGAMGTPMASPMPATPATAGQMGPLEGLDNLTWSQTEITVSPGDVIPAINVGVLEHDFVVDELGIDVDLPNGEEVEIEIPADATPGTYEFYCSVPGHAAAGMVGTLVIE